MTVANAIPSPAPVAPVKCALTPFGLLAVALVAVAEAPQAPPLQVPDKVPVMVGCAGDAG